MFLCLAALPLLVGCKNFRLASGEDDHFIHLPEEINATPPPPTKPLLPATIGNTWVYQIVNAETGQEKTTVTPPRIINGISTVVLRNTQSGQAPREDLFQITSTTLSHVSSSGGNTTVNLKPPMPLVRFPLTLKDPIEWQGGVMIGSGLVPSHGRSQLREMEQVTVPAGTFMAYRVDSALNTQLREGTSTFWTTRWFAEGVGIVKTRYMAHTPNQPDRVFSKELVSYTLKE